MGFFLGEAAGRMVLAFWGKKLFVCVQSAQMVGVGLVGCDWDFGKDFFFCLVWGGVGFGEV